MTVHTALWQRVEGYGLEYCDIELKPVISLDGHVITKLDNHITVVGYHVRCATDGSTQSVRLSSRVDGVEQNLSLEHRPTGEWFRDGEELKQFHGLIDVDLGITPATNMLPIRRFNLSPGESKELTAVWVRFPDMTVAPLRQRYQRINENTYLYQSVESGYQARLHVDTNGIVVVYENAWEEVSARSLGLSEAN